MNLILLVFIAMLSGCATDAKLQAQIDQVNRLDYHKSYDNQGDANWAVGQWVLYRTSTRSQEEIFRFFDKEPIPGFRKITITGKTGSSFWLEQQIVGPKQEETIAALVDVAASQGKSRFNIVRIKFTQSDGKVVEIDNKNIADSQAENAWEEMQYLINLFEHSHKHGRIGTISVPAGTFNNAYEIPFSMSRVLGQEKGNVFYSHAVPILTLVKLQATDTTSRWFKNTSTWEIADFGHSGGSSHFSFQGQSRL